MMAVRRTRSALLLLVALLAAAGVAPAALGRAAALAPASQAPAAQSPPGSREVILATTTSTQDSGLLDVLLPLFERASGYQVKPIAVGTGQALALGERAEADVVLVHAPDAELAWMAAGHGTQRLLVMHNDFVLVGPPNDPAAIRGAPTAVEALQRIAATRAPFVSRGDNSGTDILEKALWQRAGLAPVGSAWYLEVGQGMGQTLNVADDRRAYTLTDRGTWLARRNSLDLPILVEGDPGLLNVYHVMPVNPARSDRVNAAGGEAFALWLVSPQAQGAIAEYGVDRYGQPLFYPDAGRGEADLGSR
jgi:tungstate transport system substrate-binding protein